MATAWDSEESLEHSCTGECAGMETLLGTGIGRWLLQPAQQLCSLGGEGMA